MSGSNQSQQLQGMLGRLSGAFSMENMGGAGAAYAQNIRDYNAPELDANDEESLLARQRWAQSNGYQDEANNLGVRLGEVGAANKVRADRVEFNDARGALSQLEQQRREALSGKSAQEQVSINKNFDQAAQTLGQRINSMAGNVSGTTGTEGTDAVTSSAAGRRVSSTINNMLPTLREDQKGVALMIRQGLDDQTLSAKEGIEAIQELKSGGELSYMNPNLPSKVREHLYVKGLTEPEQKLYFDNLRASQLVDAGGGQTDTLSSNGDLTTIVTRDDFAEREATTDAQVAGAVEDSTLVSKGIAKDFDASADRYSAARDTLDSVNYQLIGSREALAQVKPDPITGESKVNTGPILPRLQAVLGLGTEDQGRFKVKGAQAAMEFLQGFKGPTTDFEWTKSEVASFLSIYQNEEVNTGVMEEVIKALERRAAVAQREMNESLTGMSSFVNAENSSLSEGVRQSYKLRRDALVNASGGDIASAEVKIPEEDRAPNTSTEGVTPSGNKYTLIPEGS